MIVWPCIVTNSLWIKPTNALKSNFIGITTLHISGSLSTHHQEFLAVHRLWYILCTCDDRLLPGVGWNAVPSYSFAIIKCVLHSCFIFRIPGFKFRTETLFLYLSYARLFQTNAEIAYQIRRAFFLLCPLSLLYDYSTLWGLCYNRCH